MSFKYFGLVCSSLVVALVVSLAAFSAQAQLEYRIGKRIQNAAFSDSRSSELVCSMSLFFSVDPDDRLLPSGGPTKLDGRGLMSCKNELGFTSELPILAELEADLPKALRKVTTVNGEDSVPSEVSFSANSSSFVIPREVNQIYDIYNVRSFSWDKSPSAGELALTFRGTRNDLVIGMKINSRSSNLSELKVKTIRLSFDDQAPDLVERL
jgi:hypothetical protein